MTFWSRSAGIVDWVWLTGIVLPGLSTVPVLAGLALDEVLADQRLRARLAERVGVELPEPGLGDADRDHRVSVLVIEVERTDRPGPDAGDLEVGAGDQAEGVVELDLVRADGAVVRRAAGEDQKGAGRKHDQRDEDDALHGPVGTCFGLHGISALGVVERAALHRARAAVALAGGQALLLAPCWRSCVIFTSCWLSGRLLTAPASLAPSWLMTPTIRLDRRRWRRSCPGG